MSGAINAVTSLFKKPKKAAVPKVSTKAQRRPVQDDASSLAARQRQQLRFKNRKGRESTILSDQLRELTGSSGRSLGG